MTGGALDPVIHAPGRLRILAAPAAPPEGDALWRARLRHMPELPPGNLITHLRGLEDAGYWPARRPAMAEGGTLSPSPARPPGILPEVTVVSAQVSFSRAKRRRPGHPPCPAPGPKALPRRRGRTRGGSS